MIEMLAALASSPFVLLLLALAAGGIGLSFLDARPEHDHYFAHRHPSGTWRCTGCPATRDRHGRITP